MIDYTDNWAKWENLIHLRDTDPIQVAAEFLRTNGYIVETPEQAVLPVQVARTGTWTKAPFNITLHSRVTVGDRKLGVDYAVQIHLNDIDARAFSGPIAAKFVQSLMEEIRPQIELGCQRELDRAREEMREGVVA